LWRSQSGSNNSKHVCVILNCVGCSCYDRSNDGAPEQRRRGGRQRSGEQHDECREHVLVDGGDHCQSQQLQLRGEVVGYCSGDRRSHGAMVLDRWTQGLGAADLEEHFRRICTAASGRQGGLRESRRRREREVRLGGRRDHQICDTDVATDRIVAVPLEPGGLLVFHGLLHHGTPPNASPRRRRALQFWDVRDGLQRHSREEHQAIWGSEGKDETCF